MTTEASSQSQRHFQRVPDKRSPENAGKGNARLHDQTTRPGGRHEGVLGILPASRKQRDRFHLRKVSKIKFIVTISNL